MKEFELLIEQGVVKKSTSPVQTCVCCGKEEFVSTRSGKVSWLLCH